MKPQGFAVSLLRHERHETGHVHPCRTCVRARRLHQGRAHTGGTFLVPDVRNVFIAEMPDGGQHRVRRRLPQAAQRGILDLVAEIDQPLDVTFFAFAFADAVEDLQHALGAHAARHALAARLVLDKVQEVARHVDHAGVLVHDDQTRPIP